MPECVRVGDVSVRLSPPPALHRFVDVAGLLGTEEVAEPPYWMHLWPGAMALARRVLASPEIGPGVRVLELGCGLALPGIVATLRGADVVATDREHAPLRLATESARLNGSPLVVTQMDWCSPALKRRFDVCLGAEVGYDRDAEVGLVRTLGATVCRGGVTWLADSVNTHRASLTDHLAAAGFRVAREDVREEEDGRPVWVRVLEVRRLK